MESRATLGPPETQGSPGNLEPRACRAQWGQKVKLDQTERRAEPGKKEPKVPKDKREDEATEATKASVVLKVQLDQEEPQDQRDPQESQGPEESGGPAETQDHRENLE